MVQLDDRRVLCVWRDMVVLQLDGEGTMKQFGAPSVYPQGISDVCILSIHFEREKSKRQGICKEDDREKRQRIESHNLSDLSDLSQIVITVGGDGSTLVLWRITEDGLSILVAFESLGFSISWLCALSNGQFVVSTGTTLKLYDLSVSNDTFGIEEVVEVELVNSSDGNRNLIVQLEEVTDGVVVVRSIFRSIMNRIYIVDFNERKTLWEGFNWNERGVAITYVTPLKSLGAVAMLSGREIYVWQLLPSNMVKTKPPF